LATAHHTQRQGGPVWT